MIAFDVWRDKTKASQENLRVGKVHNLCELNPPPSHPGAINNGLLLSSSPVNTSLPGVAHEGPPPGLLTPSTIYSVTPSLVSADGLWTVQEFNLAVSKYIVPPLDPPPLARVLRSSDKPTRHRHAQASGLRDAHFGVAARGAIFETHYPHL